MNVLRLLLSFPSLIAWAGLLFPLSAATFEITEFLAVNATGIEDADGAHSDWIEIHNLSNEEQNLEGWYLSDDDNHPRKWKCPSFRIPAQGYGTVYASGKDRHSLFVLAVHTNFSLARSGGYLSLANPEGTVVQALPYPGQRPDFAYGLTEDTENPIFMHPTPGAPNKGRQFVDTVADTKFSVDRGFFTEAFEVEITTETEGAKILYTLNGESPRDAGLFTGAVGEVYSGPIRIDRTTTLRAAAFKAGHLPSLADTQTYLFPEDVIRQPANPEGFPATWVDYPADYAMDPRVVDDPAYRDEIIEGLQSLPSMSVVMSIDDMFGPQNGIYSRSTDRGDIWEKEGSVELIHPDGSRGFQENCGIRIHGFGWRSHQNTHKHSFRLEFRERYGKTKLDYQLFPDAPVERFDSIVLRSQGSKGWQDFRDPEQTQYLHDTFARDTARDMGKIDGHATYVHLYVNGLYWGLYNPVERPDADFAAEYFGGEPEEYDAINRRTTTNEAIDGDLDAYNEMLALAQKGVRSLEDYEAIQEYLDIDDLIDYMLIHQYTTNRDGPEEFNSNNMRGVRKREPGAQFRFFVWDMEYSLWNVDRIININVAIPGSISFVYSRLRESPEFRLRYADHVQRHLFNGGALTPGPVLERWNRRSDEIYSALIAESARWGDAKRPAQPFTRDVEWAAERRRLVEDYFPHRTGILIDQLKDAGLYPSVKAPEFFQHGGRLTEGDSVKIKPAGLFNSETYHYTLDGTDPRVYGSGEISSTAAQYEESGPGIVLTSSATVKARALRGDEWSALTEATFAVAISPTAKTLKITEIHYRPALPDLDERAAGYELRSDFEFLEIYNAGAETLDLRQLSFTRGLTLSLDQLTQPDLGPGETGLLVRNLSAFQMRYGAGLPVLGEFTRGKLDNAGETIALSLDSGEIIQGITYDDEAPWPAAADGEGHSLILKDPRSDPGDPANWAASASIGGSPGIVETAGDPGAPLEATLQLSMESVDGVDYWLLTVENATNYQLEASTDLEQWSSEDTGFELSGEHRFRSQLPVSQREPRRQYVRLRLGE